MGRPPAKSPSASAGSGAFFRIGAAVEVCSEEEGFRGAWYEATVLRSHNRRRYYTVAYSHLLADDDPSLPLRETVPRSFVRLRPPLPDADSHFELHEPVDAFHCDGWWAGVVAKLPEGGDELYSVCFPSTREEFQFTASEIRPTVQRVNGQWAPVKNQVLAVKYQGGNMMFGVGSQIEVSRDKENYGAAWFTGTIMKVIVSTNFLVEYESLRVGSDSNRRMLLKEIVDLQYVRPLPPYDPDSKNFDVNDEVEAFHQDGWYAGLVTEVLPESRYIVKFKHQEEQMEFNHTAVRPRQDWIKGHWVLPSLDQCPESPSPGRTKPAARRRKSHVGKSSSPPVLVSTSKDDNDEAKNESSSEIERSSHEGSQPNKKLKKGTKSEFSDQVAMECGPKTPKIVEKDFHAATPALKESPVLIDGHQHSDSPCGEQTAEGPDEVKTLQLESTPSRDDEKDISQVNDAARSSITMKESSNCKGKGSVNQSMENSPSSPVIDKTGDFLPIAEWGNGKGARDLKGSTHKIKKLVIRAPHRQRKTPDVAVEQVSSGEINARGLLKKRGIHRNQHSVIGIELNQQKETADPVSERTQTELSNCTVSVDVTCSTLSPLHHETALKNDNSQLKEKTEPVGEKEGRKEDAEHSGCAMSVDNFLLKETAEIVGEREDRMEETELSNCTESFIVPCRMLQPCHQEEVLEQENYQLVDRTDPLGQGEDGSEKARKQHPVEEIKSSGKRRHSKKRRIKHHSLKATKVKRLEETTTPVTVIEHGKKEAELSNRVVSADLSNDRLPPCHHEEVLAHEKNAQLEDTTRTRPPAEIEHCNGEVDPSSCMVLNNKNSQWEVTNHPHAESEDRRGEIEPSKVLDRENIQLEDTIPPPAECEDRMGELEPSSCMLSLNVSHDIPLPCQHDEWRKHGSYQLEETTDPVAVTECAREEIKSTNCALSAVEKHPSKETQKRRGRPRKMRILQNLRSIEGMEFKQSEEASNPVAEREERREEVELFNRTLSVAVLPDSPSASQHNKVLEGGLPSNDAISIYLANRQVHILRDGLMPLVDSTQVAELVKESANQQLSNKKLSSLNHRLEKIAKHVDRLDNAGVEAESQTHSLVDEDIAALSDELARSGSQSDRAIVDLERALVDPSTCGSSSGTMVMPFTKKSSLWETVESMEAFLTMPQRPHFRPLDQYCVLFREGMAIGLMTTFASLVANISKLRSVDSQETFEGILKALVPLESNGFNVQCIRSRVEKLLEIRNTLMQSEYKMIELKGKILKAEEETDQLNAVLAANDKVIVQLEERLACIREKASALLVERSTIDSEIVKLNMDVQAAEEAHHFVEQQFNGTLAALW